MAAITRNIKAWSVLAIVALGALAILLEAGNGSPTTAAMPIRHVVIVYQENHSYDNVLGLWCVRHPRRHCDGAASGRTSTGMRDPRP